MTGTQVRHFILTHLRVTLPIGLCTSNRALSGTFENRYATTSLFAREIRSENELCDRTSQEAG